jgi:hypothetical protein
MSSLVGGHRNQRKQTAELRPYAQGENMDGISVSDADAKAGLWQRCIPLAASVTKPELLTTRRSFDDLVSTPWRAFAERHRRAGWVLGFHSKTLSARESTEGGIVRPSAFAVFKLMTNSNLVGCCIGKSAGFAPFKILST